MSLSSLPGVLRVHRDTIEGQCINTSLSFTTPAPMATVGGSAGIITAKESGGYKEVICPGTSTGEYTVVSTTEVFQKTTRRRRTGP